jgi:hypothetical protein
MILNNNEGLILFSLLGLAILVSWAIDRVRTKTRKAGFVRRIVPEKRKDPQEGQSMGKSKKRAYTGNMSHGCGRKG